MAPRAAPRRRDAEARIILYRDGATVHRRGRGEAQEVGANALDWSTRYRLLLPSRLPGEARLEGTVRVRNRTGADLERAEVLLVDGSLAAGGRAGGARAPAPLTLPELLTIERGGDKEVPLFSGGAREVRASLLDVYDPVGPDRDRPTRRPIVGKGYGQSDESELTLEVDLGLDSRLARALPAGNVQVFRRRRDGAPQPLGGAEIFGGAGTGARFALGLARGLSGRRVQADYAYDEHQKRLLEEIRIVIQNRRSRVASVRVREHLVRGLNWALAYYNDAGPLEKTGPQEIEISLQVPAGGQVRAVYRVVYTW